MFELVPAFAERVRTANRETRIVGTSVANYFRKPYGPGWLTYPAADAPVERPGPR